MAAPPCGRNNGGETNGRKQHSERYEDSALHPRREEIEE